MGVATKRVWFAAHAVYCFEQLRGRQRTFTVMENVLMVRGRSAKEALAAATPVARREELNDPTLTIDDRPGRLRFLGIRKVVSCAAQAGDASSRDGRVRVMRAGVEATFLTYRVAGRAALKRLLQGKELDVTLEE